MSILKRFKKAIIFSIIISIILSMVSFDLDCSHVRDKVLRLHVVAASDTDKDQQLKLKVRDALLEKSSDIFDGTVDIENAVEKITPQISKLQKIAREVIEKNGFDYTVNISLKEEFFADRKSVV